MNRTPLQPFITPTEIVLFGAGLQHGSIGNALFNNIRNGGFSGRLLLVSDKHSEVDGYPCSKVEDINGGPASLALITTPAQSVPEIIDICAQTGIRAVIVYSSGLRESDSLAENYGRSMREAAVRGGVRIYGPKALGLIIPHINLNLTPIARNVQPGNIAIVSQSVSVCAHILDWSKNGEFGFSAIFASGETVDIDFSEILDYLARDSKTEIILLYLEGLRDVRGFLSAARSAACIKPVIAIKAGYKPQSAAIAKAHSGMIVGRDDAYDAALRRCGVLRVRSIGDMFSAARALSNSRMPGGKRLAIVSNGGGPSLMAVDYADELNIEIAELSDQTCRSLEMILPQSWYAGNPVDTGLFADRDHIIGAVSACLDDPGVDGVVVIVAPNSIIDPISIAESLIKTIEGSEKPILTCWLGEIQTNVSREVFAQAKVPSFRSPENAVLAFAFMVNWVRNQALLLETPAALSFFVVPDTEGARSIITNAIKEGRNELLPAESQAVLSFFLIPYGSGSDISARKGRFREFTISILYDPVFGPVISLSESGDAYEIYDTCSIALPPLNQRLIKEMLSVPYVFRLLGFLGKKNDHVQGTLGDILQRTSEMASELPSIRSLEIIFLINEEGSAGITDVKIQIQPVIETRTRYGHMAICPYPVHLVTRWTLKGNRQCMIRPIRPEDAEMLQDFVRRLSNRSKHFRYFGAVRELTQYQLAHDTQIDYGREMTLVATTDGNNGKEISGEAHYATMSDGESCEFAIVIADDFAGLGLGKRLMSCLIDAAREQGLKMIIGEVLTDNYPMRHLMESLDFDIRVTDEETIVEVTLLL